MTKRTLILAAAAAALLNVSAQDVKVRTYMGPNPSAPRENPVVVREILPPDPPPFVGAQPFALALMPPVQTPPREMESAFCRLNLFVGAHRAVHVFDLGVIGGIADYEMDGLAVSGIFNRTAMSPAAFQIAGACNSCGGDFSGCQIAAVWNWTEGGFAGLQIGLVNKGGRLDGLQVGGFNLAERGVGVQIGVVNVSERLEGLQIGAFNVNRDSGVPFFPVLNFAF